MKKTLTLMVMFSLVCGMLVAEIQEPAMQAENLSVRTTRPNEPVRNAPNVEFVTDPVELMTNYYDYFPGGYNRFPLVIQPETTSTGYPAGGLYLGFQSRETSAAERRVYFAYFTPDGQLVQRSTVSTDNVWEGFPGTGMDPITGNPFIAYHRLSPDQTYDCYMSYDLFHLLAAPGAWKSPFIVIDNPEVGTPFTGATNDEFIWPKVAVGPSPIEGKSRVFIYGDNATSNSAGVANYNMLIGKADFDGDMMAAQMDLEFEYTTIPELDDMHYNDIDRAIKDIVVSDDGQVAFVGWHGHTFFVVYSDDYGDTYTYMEANGRWDLENPQNLDGTYYFENDDGTAAEIFAYPSSDGGHFNAVFTDNNTKIVAMSAFGINKQESFDTGFYLPAIFFPKMYQYTIENNELNVHVIDMYITGADAYDGNPAIPWDLDEDGEVDEYTENGFVGFAASMPSHFFNGDYQTAFFHESNFKVTSKGNWIVAVWQDCENHYFNYYDEPGYEGWAAKPEIMISVSADYGDTWSEPAKMNAKVDDDNYYPQFNGMIPVYIYPADQLEIIDEMTAKLHIFFTNDYSYGSFVQSEGQNIGSMTYYASLAVDMPAPYIGDSSTGEVELPAYDTAFLFNNYPNPFNPSTMIKFETKTADHVVIDVFNLKGQKVATLANDFYPVGTHQVEWNGKDSNNQSVSSGVYFYKMRSGRYTATKKMILMK
jgi:hypothetical protein